MRDVGVGRVVLISSGAVYGDQQEQPLREDAPPSPRSPYAVSKLAAEYYVRTIGALWGIETVSLRVFNAYGPGQHLPPSHPPVIPNFIRQGLRGGSLVVHGDGNQTRDFIFVNDVVRAMISTATATTINQLVINVGSGLETSVRTVAQKVLELTGNKAELLFTPRNDPGVSRMCADISLAREKLDYQPRHDLDEGLRLTLEQDERFQSRRNGGNEK
jgi:UDP-glucose 4-epimerase